MLLDTAPIHLIFPPKVSMEQVYFEQKFSARRAQHSQVSLFYGFRMQAWYNNTCVIESPDTLSSLYRLRQRGLREETFCFEFCIYYHVHCVYHSKRLSRLRHCHTGVSELLLFGTTNLSPPESKAAFTILSPLCN